MITAVATISTRVTTYVNYTTWAEVSVLPSVTDTADNTFIDGKVQVKILGDRVVDASDFFDLHKNYGKT